MESLFGRKNDFLDGGFSLNINKQKQYTVVVIYMDGYKKEYNCIERPWQYVSKVKKNPNVRTCYVK